MTKLVGDGFIATGTSFWPFTNNKMQLCVWLKSLTCSMWFQPWPDYQTNSFILFCNWYYDSRWGITILVCLQNSRLLFQWHAFLCYIQQNNDNLKGIDIETTGLYMTDCWHSAFSSDNFCSWWRHQMETFQRYWPFVRGIRRLSVDSPHKGQWRGVMMFLWSAPEQTVE